MIGVVFDGSLRLARIDAPVMQPGDVVIKTILAGICATDHEITRGYVPGFSGVLGHEFVGRIVDARDPSLRGKRVTAEINCACGTCEFCAKGLGRHCAHRSVLGILNRNGCCAELVAVPAVNVVEIPDGLTDEEAIFIEPLAAALEILEQIAVRETDRVLLLGDGKLAQLIGLAMQSTGCDLTVVGKHGVKLAVLSDRGIRTVTLEKFLASPHDIVIEATGNPDALNLAIRCVRPRGTLVLKSTYAGNLTFNPASIVVNELTVVGSRCGRFDQAITFLRDRRPALGRLISGRFPVRDALSAFALSARKESLKVLIHFA